MKFIPEKLGRSVARKILETKKESPHIFFAVGIVGVVGATVLACRATMRLEETVDEIEEEFESIASFERTEEANGAIVTQSDHYKAVGTASVHAVGKLGRLYGPAIAVGTVSVVCLTGSHVQLTKRNAALTAAFAGLSQVFDEYRGRVSAELGEAREKEIYNNVVTKEIEIDGKPQLVKTVGPYGMSQYARCFDETTKRFEKNYWENNLYFLRGIQNTANDRLRSHGHLFLNEVYDDLGFERTTPGSVVGWLWKGEGDNYITFGLDEEWNEAFVQGLERAAWLDFNVDGVIYDKI